MSIYKLSTKCIYVYIPVLSDFVFSNRKHNIHGWTGFIIIFYPVYPCIFVISVSARALSNILYPILPILKMFVQKGYSNNKNFIFPDLVYYTIRKNFCPASS